MRRATSSEEDLETYYALHCETYKRSGISPHPRTYFEIIWSDFVARDFAIVFFAELAGRVIAADNEAFFKNAMSGWTAAGTEIAARVGANNLLHWHAMQWAKENGALTYESGEAFPGARGGKAKGLNDFKKSFGGELFPIYKGECEVSLPARTSDQGVAAAIVATADSSTETDPTPASWRRLERLIPRRFLGRRR